MAESKSRHSNEFAQNFHKAVIAQLGERQTEDLKVPGSIPGRGIFFPIFIKLTILDLRI